jgi:Cu(I)/Ag(I) efflux system membrane fusion protein
MNNQRAIATFNNWVMIFIQVPILILLSASLVVAEENSNPLAQMQMNEHAGHEHQMPSTSQHSQKKESSLYTCSMHPQIKMDKPGKCPICGMDLIPVALEDTEDSSDDGSQVSLTLSHKAEQLAEVETAVVKRQYVTKEIRMVGSVDFDETRLTHITAWVPGRIERMFVDYTGVSVKKDDHMLELYSPELLSTQEELIQAARSIGRLRNSESQLVKKSSEQALHSARAKLLLLGLTENQVSNIETSGKAKDTVVIYSPAGGVVVEKNATEGMYVQTGTRIYSIADLSNLWLHLDAYESDLPWIRYGQEIEFSTAALPGKTFTGKISFISPFLDTKTRTTKVRVNVTNLDGLLKPGLFVRGIVKATAFGEGKVIDTSLQGKYIGPMHPEITRDNPGQCPICGMDLVSAEELGYITDEVKVSPPIVIPTTAPLITGKRAVVYVKSPNSSRYESRDIILGPRAGNFYIVEEGLEEGELVVTNGAFKIDADLQIRGKKSMMAPSGGDEMKGHAGHKM